MGFSILRLAGLGFSVSYTPRAPREFISKCKVIVIFATDIKLKDSEFVRLISVIMNRGFSF